MTIQARRAEAVGELIGRVRAIEAIEGVTRASQRRLMEPRETARSWTSRSATARASSRTAAGSVSPRRVLEDQAPTPSIFTRPRDSRISWVVSPALQRRSASQ